jgi:hypothetical protein
VVGALAFPVVVLAAVAAGTGWLYLMRSWHLLGFGPGVPGALELERLAGADAQPLGRFVAAWLPAGLACGAALGALLSLRRAVLAAGAGVCALVMLLVLGAASNAIENSETLGRHLGDQVGRAAPWCAAALIIIGAYLGAHAPAGRRERGARGSSAR